MIYKVGKLVSVVLAAVMLFSGCAAEKEEVSGTGNTGKTNGGASGASSATPAQGADLLSSFRTKDMQGKDVDQSVLQGYELTMINVWTTYCGYCIKEMPDLAELAEKNKANGVQIIGLVADVLNYDGSISAQQMATAKEIVQKTGANYTHLIPSNSLAGVLSMATSVPMTIFVDKDGRQVGEDYLGAKNKASWQKIIDQMLAEVRK